MNQLYEKYREQGLEILAFPCNAAQEPGTRDETKEFVCTRFKSEFPIFEKVQGSIEVPNFYDSQKEFFLILLIQWIGSWKDEIQ
ncbi:hypothetical protein MLD38_027780 [Melastoma candidum]|uniref:Uncharacterized protein n=1 Tax=Melastoma candidum TaxID=119954 RepID=A0ACB9P3S7_9MYRT|nr:hypothetical protein MLD38_027780 [Melastoma candidum]